MLGDNYSGRYEEDEIRMMHSDFQSIVDEDCNGELEEFVVDGRGSHPVYRCSVCGKEFTLEDLVSNAFERIDFEDFE